MSGVVNNIKHTLAGDKTSTTHTGAHNAGTAEGVHGHHNSHAANAADPRIDSDLDESRNAGLAHNTHNTHSSGLTGNTTGIGSTAHTGHNTAHSGVTGTHTGAHNTSGPHNSDLLNKADPRVDSDNSKLHSSHHTAGGIGSTGVGHNTHSSGYTGAHNTTTHTGTHTSGPHNSDLLNKTDPRVDSDNSKLHGSHNTTGHGAGIGSTGVGHSTSGPHVGGTGTHGGISNSSNAGPHNSNLANKADPTVDSDLSGRGKHVHSNVLGSGTHATPGSGTAQNTAGPHNSDLLNKLDPRVE